MARTGPAVIITQTLLRRVLDRLGSRVVLTVLRDIWC
jgi:hypothetical protein